MGDSGGPLLASLTTGFVQVGITSYGVDTGTSASCNGRHDNVGAYTSVAKIRPWLTSQFTKFKL